MPKAGVRIGISGWTYVPWRGVFYPKDVTQKRELEFASRKLNSIEINGTFYSLQRPASFQAWHDATPDDFVFSLKGGKFITHLKRLKEIEIPLANFFASGVLALKHKLGPILWQFPANFVFDAERFERFFRLLPPTTLKAAAFAKKHDVRMKGRTWLAVEDDRPMRYAVEVRHESFKDARFVTLCRKYGVAVVVADAANDWPVIEDVTADFMYVRLHGHEELYVSGYDDAALKRWATRVEAWKGGSEPKDARRVNGSAARSRGRDVFVYFDNDAKVHSPRDAMRLAALLAGRDSLDGKNAHGKPRR